MVLGAPGGEIPSGDSTIASVRAHYKGVRSRPMIRPYQSFVALSLEACHPSTLPDTRGAYLSQKIGAFTLSRVACPLEGIGDSDVGLQLPNSERGFEIPL
jgi:hypothetical protein